MPEVDLSRAMTWRQLAAGIARIPEAQLDEPVLYDISDEMPKSRILLPVLERHPDDADPITDDDSPLPGPEIRPGTWYLWG